MKLSSSGYEEDYPLSPVFSQEFAPDTQSQPCVLLPVQDEAGTSETGKRVRASFTALGLALSLGATGSLVSSAEAADSMQLAALPSVAGSADPLPSFGSSRPEGTSASYHTVADGETIWDIAKQHGLTVEDIKLANGIAEGQVIQSGQVLKVPTVAVNASPLLNMPEELDTVDSEVATPESAEQGQEPVEVAVVAASESDVPVQLQKAKIEELQLSEPRLTPVESAAGADTPDSVVAEPSLEEDVRAEFELRAPRALPMSKADPLSSRTDLALLPETEPQAESIQQFAEQLETVRETAEKGKVASARSGSVARMPQEGSLTHRVGSGETIWSIARSYGLNPDDLQQANEIEDPRFIVPGDELTIPAGQLSEVSQDPAVERLSRLPIANEQQMAAIAPLVETSTPATESVEITIADKARAVALTPPASVATVREGTAVAAADPFVEDLLSEVAAATRSRVGETAREAAELSADFTPEASKSVVETAEATEIAVNPQFSEVSDIDNTDVESRSDVDDLLAAAPLGSEVYAPVIENPTGRVVTPEMPVLPGRDAYLPEAPNRFDGYMWPAQGVLTSGYGWRWGRMHRGVDIAGPVGTPIYAAGPGVVVSSGWNSGGYGNMVDIRHPDGSMTRYAHNSRLLVNAGQQVRQGQQIAEMGSTGYSTGPHLHFEIHIPNQGTVNPIAMLPGR